MSDLTSLETAERLELLIDYAGDTLDDALGFNLRKAVDSAASLCLQLSAGEYKQVVHAHWIDFLKNKKEWLRDDGKSVFMECSKCHEKICRNLMFTQKYCPSCGALMDEKDDSHT